MAHYYHFSALMHYESKSPSVFSLIEHHIRVNLFKIYDGVLITSGIPRASRTWVHCIRVKHKKLPVVKIIFTISNVVELSSIGAISASPKNPAIGASFACLHFVHCLMRGFWVFANNGKIWFLDYLETMPPHWENVQVISLFLSNL